MMQDLIKKGRDTLYSAEVTKDGSYDLTEDEKKAIIDAFYNFEIGIQSYSLSDTDKRSVMFYEPEDYLYSITKEFGMMRIPRGSWAMMNAIVPVILKDIVGPVVEIGMGESSEVLADHAYQADRKLYSCDLQMGGMFNVYKKPLFDDHICFIGRSEEFIKDLEVFPAVVFLDGEHTYKTLRMEVDYFLPRLQTGGVMFIHDTFPNSVRMVQKDGTGTMPEDIYRIRQELERNPDLDVFTWPYTALSCGLTMVMKHVPNRTRDYWRLNGRASGGHETHK